MRHSIPLFLYLSKRVLSFKSHPGKVEQLEASTVMDSNSTGLIGPPFVVTSTDHGAYIIITASMGMSFAILSYLLRIYTRYHITGLWDWSDHAVTATTVFYSSSISVSLCRLFWDIFTDQ